MNALNKVLEFFLDMKNILSLGALYVFIYAVQTGLFDNDQSYSIVLMTFTFFLGFKVGTSIVKK